MEDKLMIPCKKATQLISESMDRRLSLREFLALKIHLRVCHACIFYLRHIKTLREILRRYTHTISLSSLGSLSLSDHQRQHMKAFLREHLPLI